MKVSIIIPVYNVSTYLTSCLESCVNQTYKDIEIICVNDGSPDNSLAIIKKYQEADKRVVCISKREKVASRQLPEIIFFILMVMMTCPIMQSSV